MIVTVETIKEIEGKWKELLEESETATVFQQPEWLTVWVKYAGIEPIILGVDEGEGLVGVGIFEMRKETIIFGGMRPTWGQAFALSDFGDIVAKRGSEKAAWREILQFFKSHFPKHSVSLYFVREQSPSLGLLPEVAKELGLGITIEKQEVSPVIKVPKSWEEYTRRLGQRRRKELERKLRKTEVAGVVSLRVVEDDVSEHDTEKIIQLIRKSSPEKDAFMDEYTADFFKDVMRSMVPAGLAKLFFLSIDDEVVAGVLGFHWRNGWYLYNGGFDPGRGLYAPGVTLSGKIIQEAIKRGIKRVDFLRGGERYKYDLGAKDDNLYQLKLEGG